MRTIPITSDRNNPIYQERTGWEKEMINERICDDNCEPCNMVGTYRFAQGFGGCDDCIDFNPDAFKLVAITEGYEPVISEEAKRDCILELLKAKHGRNVNFI
ncbi:MAG TPA: hypothetical protein VFZ33_01110 [Chitinophagaceae bacterium]